MAPPGRLPGGLSLCGGGQAKAAGPNQRDQRPWSGLEAHSPSRSVVMMSATTERASSPDALGGQDHLVTCMAPSVMRPGRWRRRPARHPPCGWRRARPDRSSLGQQGGRPSVQTHLAGHGDPKFRHGLPFRAVWRTLTVLLGLTTRRGLGTEPPSAICSSASSSRPGVRRSTW